MLVHEWDILSRRVERFRAARPLSGHMLFVIQHVLDDLAHLISAFVNLGCEPSDITVIGIPYSSRQNAGDAIAAMGCRVVLPAVFPMDGIVGKLLVERVSTGFSQKKPLIILEDGGYAVPQLSQLAKQGLLPLDSVKGAVEQTTRGKWLAQRVDQDGYLVLPVISIPDCQTKSAIEPPYIAQAVIRNLATIMNEVAPGRTIEMLGMYGYGTIGDQVGKYFRERGARVCVADLTPAKRFRALTSHLNYEELNEVTLPQCDLLLGTTGSTSIGPGVISLLKHGTLLGSTSSRQIEIDMEYLSKDSLRSEVVEPRSPCVMKIPAARRFNLVRAKSSKDLTLLYDGYPINFWGTSLPDHVSDAILSLLLEGVLAIADGEYQPGVLPGDRVLIDADLEITRVFKEIEKKLGFAS